MSLKVLTVPEHYLVPFLFKVFILCTGKFFFKHIFNQMAHILMQDNEIISLVVVQIFRICILDVIRLTVTPIIWTEVTCGV